MASYTKTAEGLQLSPRYQKTADGYRLRGAIVGGTSASQGRTTQSREATRALTGMNTGEAVTERAYYPADPSYVEDCGFWLVNAGASAKGDDLGTVIVLDQDLSPTPTTYTFYTVAGLVQQLNLGTNADGSPRQLALHTAQIDVYDSENNLLASGNGAGVLSGHTHYNGQAFHWGVQPNGAVNFTKTIGRALSTTSTGLLELRIDITCHTTTTGRRLMHQSFYDSNGDLKDAATWGPIEAEQFGVRAASRGPIDAVYWPDAGATSADAWYDPASHYDCVFPMQRAVNAARRLRDEAIAGGQTRPGVWVRDNSAPSAGRSGGDTEILNPFLWVEVRATTLATVTGGGPMFQLEYDPSYYAPHTSYSYTDHEYLTIAADRDVLYYRGPLNVPGQVYVSGRAGTEFEGVVMPSGALGRRAVPRQAGATVWRVLGAREDLPGGGWADEATRWINKTLREQSYHTLAPALYEDPTLASLFSQATPQWMGAYKESHFAIGNFVQDANLEGNRGHMEVEHGGQDRLTFYLTKELFWNNAHYTAFGTHHAQSLEYDPNTVAFVHGWGAYGYPGKCIVQNEPNAGFIMTGACFAGYSYLDHCLYGVTGTAEHLSIYGPGGRAAVVLGGTLWNEVVVDYQVPNAIRRANGAYGPDQAVFEFRVHIDSVSLKDLLSAPYVGNQPQSPRQSDGSLSPLWGNGVDGRTVVKILYANLDRPGQSSRYGNNGMLFRGAGPGLTMLGAGENGLAEVKGAATLFGNHDNGFVDGHYADNRIEGYRLYPGQRNKPPAILAATNWAGPENEGLRSIVKNVELAGDWTGKSLTNPVSTLSGRREGQTGVLMEDVDYSMFKADSWFFLDDNTSDANVKDWWFRNFALPETNYNYLFPAGTVATSSRVHLLGDTTIAIATRTYGNLSNMIGRLFFDWSVVDRKTGLPAANSGQYTVTATDEARGYALIQTGVMFADPNLSRYVVKDDGYAIPVTAILGAGEAVLFSGPQTFNGTDPRNPWMKVPLTDQIAGSVLDWSCHVFPIPQDAPFDPYGHESVALPAGVVEVDMTHLNANGNLHLRDHTGLIVGQCALGANMAAPELGVDGLTFTSAEDIEIEMGAFPDRSTSTVFVRVSTTDENATFMNVRTQAPYAFPIILASSGALTNTPGTESHVRIDGELVADQSRRGLAAGVIDGEPHTMEHYSLNLSTWSAVTLGHYVNSADHAFVGKIHRFALHLSDTHLALEDRDDVVRRLAPDAPPTVDLALDPTMAANNGTTVGTSTLVADTFPFGVSVPGIKWTQQGTDFIQLWMQPQSPVVPLDNLSGPEISFLRRCNTAGANAKLTIYAMGDTVHYFGSGGWTSSVADYVLPAVSLLNVWERVRVQLDALPAGTTHVAVRMTRNPIGGHVTDVADFHLYQPLA